MTIAVVQAKVGSGTAFTVTLDSPPTAGNVLFATGGTDGSSDVLPADMTGWSGTGTANAPGFEMAIWRTVQPGDPSTWDFATSAPDARVVLVEVAGVVATGSWASARDTASTEINFPDTDPPGPVFAMVGAVYGSEGDPATALAGVTQLDDGALDGGVVSFWAGYRLDPGDIGATISPADWGAVQMRGIVGVTDFSGSPTSGDAPQTVAFSDGSTDGPSTWLWDFGDGTTSTDQNPSHDYAAGTWTVSLTTDTGSARKVNYIVVARVAIALDVYRLNPDAGEDVPAMTYLATFSGAFDKQIRPELNRPGSGQFSIRRDDPDATDDNLAQGNVVKVRIPQIDPDPIFAFLIQKTTTTVVSPEEGGGEIVTAGGDGVLAYWDWARWLQGTAGVQWWEDAWGTPPDGTLGHVEFAAGDYWDYTITAGRIASRTSVHTGGFSAWYDSRKSYKWAVGTPFYGRVATLVHLSSGFDSGHYFHPMDAGIVETRAVVGVTEFGDIGASDVTQWWDSAWGTPPGGTEGRVAISAGTYYRYTVSGGKITARTTFTTGGLSAWYDSRKSYHFAHGTAVATLVHLSSGTLSGDYIHPMDHGIREYKASTPVVSLVPGKVLWRIYEEVENPDRPSHPLVAMTIDFDETTDSDGNDWTVTDSLAGITADVGESMLSTVAKIVATGVVDVEMGPDMDFHAWSEVGRDLTGDDFGTGVVRFVKGTGPGTGNIATELQREETDGPIPTFTQVVGNDGYAQATLPDADGRLVRETSTQASTDDADALATWGLADLLNRQARADAAGFQVITGNDEAAGLYLPGPRWTANGKYWLGDITTLHTGDAASDFDEAAVAVIAITFGETESGDLIVIPETSAALGAAEDAAFPGSATPTTSGGGASLDGSGTTIIGTTTGGTPDLSVYDHTHASEDFDAAGGTPETFTLAAAPLWVRRVSLDGVRLTAASVGGSGTSVEVTTTAGMTVTVDYEVAP